MTKTIQIGNGSELHIENPDAFILETLGSRPLCGGVRINGKAQKIRVHQDRLATCSKCLTKAEKLSL